MAMSSPWWPAEAALTQVAAVVALAGVSGIPVALLAAAALQLPSAALFARVRHVTGQPEPEARPAPA